MAKNIELSLAKANSTPEAEATLKLKQKEFCDAIKRYKERKVYNWFNLSISTLNVGLQIVLLLLLIGTSLPWYLHLLTFFVSYLLADFINGIVHLFMDHNHHYSSFIGPLVAAFHLHHDRPRYTDKHLHLVYFYESGFKVWLAPYLVLTVVLTVYSNLPSTVLAVLVYFGILSSFAEVSHYLCHNSNARSTRFFQKIGLILPVEHHARHHEEDNVNYAFLNGWSDPLINWFARHFCSGYLSSTDRHSELYHQQLNQSP